MNEMSFQHYLLGLFAVANNIAAIPLYINLIQGRTVKEQHKICSTATLASFITMITSMFAGLAVLNFFQISVPAFRIAGGLLLLSTGFSMMNSIQKSLEVTDQTFSKIISTAIIPIAIPITTGAGTMSTIILFAEYAKDKPYLHFSLMGAIAAMTVIIYLSFFYAPRIVRYLGATGLDVLTKIFGLITLALGIQFILTGISDAFPGIM
ncbi:MAG: MarC family protein [Bacteroidetes bacterium]|nr:MarC family protein [Bacteroidota bacterium]